MDLRTLIGEIPDFPKQGIVFRDIGPLMRNPSAWKEVVNQLCKLVRELEPDIIVGIESRGFIIGASIATIEGVSFIPIRKKGKLPGKTIKINYELEYGIDSLEIQAEQPLNNERIVIIDDLLATGGTASASAKLLTKAGGRVIGFGFIIELKGLNGRLKLPSGCTIQSLVSYD